LKENFFKITLILAIAEVLFAERGRKREREREMKFNVGNGVFSALFLKDVRWRHHNKKK